MPGLLFCLNVCAQDKLGDVNTEKEYIKFYFGVGAGLNYGGLGLNAEYLPIKSLGIFLGLGYNLVDPAYNAGVSYKLRPGKKIKPMLLAMYGYNAAIKIKGAYGDVISAKTYIGISAGAGADFSSRAKKSKLSIAILVPFRNAAFRREYNYFKDAGYKFKPGILPITVSLGFKYPIK